MSALSLGVGSKHVHSVYPHRINPSFLALVSPLSLCCFTFPHAIHSPLSFSCLTYPTPLNSSPFTSLFPLTRLSLSISPSLLLSFFFPNLLWSLSFLILLCSSRSALRVLWRVGLRPRGPCSRRRGDHHYGNLHNDDGPRTSHPAEVWVPRSSWQEDPYLRQPQRSAQVSEGVGLSGLM